MGPMAGNATFTSAARDAVTTFFSEEAGDRAGRDRLVMARALGALFFAGALVGLVSLLLPHAADANLGVIAAVCAIALAAGGGLIVGGGRVPGWTLPAGCYAATALIATGLYYSD